MEQRTDPSGGLTVWIDGGCEVCRRSESWCRSRDHHDRLRFKDVTTTPLDELPRSPKAMMGAVHVSLPDGSVAAGYDAWRLILRDLDGWRWLARVAGLPGVAQLGPRLYSLVASNRHRWPFRRR